MPVCCSLGPLPVTKATVHQGWAGLPSGLPGCLLAVLECSGREFTPVTWAEAQLELGKQTRAGVTGLLYLASPPGQEPAPLKVPLSEPDPWTQLCQKVSLVCLAGHQAATSICNGKCTDWEPTSTASGKTAEADDRKDCKKTLNRSPVSFQTRKACS